MEIYYADDDYDSFEPYYTHEHFWQFLEIDWGFYVWVCLDCGEMEFED